MDKELRIDIPIAQRHYSIKINRDDSNSEQTLRKAGEMVNKSVEQFKELNLENKDDQDYLAMAGINIAVHALDMQNENSMEEIITELRNLSLTLDSHLTEA